MGENKRWFVRLVGASLTFASTVIANKFTESLSNLQSWGIILLLATVGIMVTYLVSRFPAVSQEQDSEVVNKRVNELKVRLRKQVQARSYGSRRKLIESPLRELALDIRPRVGWVRDPRLVEPEPLPEKPADAVVAAFESARRRLLIVGEPGSGKTMAAYSLIEYLDVTEGAERIPLLVNLSAWEDKDDDFETFLVDYLCSSGGYDETNRTVASAFVSSDRYSLILDGLDEIPAGFRKHFSERLDKFLSELTSGDIGVVVTSRTREYKELRVDYPDGLGVVQAVEILPLTSSQLDNALAELANDDKDWELFLSERDLTESQRVRNVLSNPLLLNLAVAGRIPPRQLLECGREEELQTIVIEVYLARTLADQRQYEQTHARRYLSWIARFLNGVEVSPYELKTSDLTVFNLADLTPLVPPKYYRLVVGLVAGLASGLFMGLASGLAFGLFGGLASGLAFGLFIGLFVGLSVQVDAREIAANARMPSFRQLSKQQRRNFLKRLASGLAFGLFIGLGSGLFMGLGFGLFIGLGFGLFLGLGFGLFLGLTSGWEMLMSVQAPSHAPQDAYFRSVFAALSSTSVGLFSGLFVGLGLGLGLGLDFGLGLGLFLGLGFGLGPGLFSGLNNGGWFVLLQELAHRRLALVGNLPPRPYDFLEWGVDRQIFRRVGGGVRFRHNLIQQHLASIPEGDE